MTEWKPAAYPSLSPYLICPEPEQLIDFLVAVFDARLERRFNHPDGALGHAELRIDDSVVMIGGGQSEYLSAEVHLHLYVPDAQAVYDRAMAAGGTAVREPERKADDDDLRGGFRDPAGTIWWVATQ